MLAKTSDISPLFSSTKDQKKEENKANLTPYTCHNSFLSNTLLILAYSANYLLPANISYLCETGFHWLHNFLNIIRHIKIGSQEAFIKMYLRISQVQHKAGVIWCHVVNMVNATSFDGHTK